MTPTPTKMATSKRSKDFHIAFREYVPPGHSKFSINIDESFRGRQFYFDNITVVPAFYSIEAAVLNLDPDDELKENVYYPIYFVAKLPTDFFPGEFQSIPSQTNPVLLATSLNTYFQGEMPSTVSHLGVFFDWTDVRFDPLSGSTWDDWVQNVMAQTYYGESYDPVKHKKKLPATASTVSGANDYLFPTELSVINILNLRFRLNIAPNVTIIASTQGQLSKMGFSDQQLGVRRGKGTGQFLLINTSTISFRKMVANNPASYVMSDLKLLKISLVPTEEDLVTAYLDVEMNREEELKNVFVEKAVSRWIAILSDLANINLSIHYDEGTKKFTFIFPPNLQFAIGIDTALAWRMGYGIVSKISELNATSDKVDDEINLTHTLKKSRALCYDTGVVIVSDWNTSSNTFSGSDHHYMASLYPQYAGTLEMVAPRVTMPGKYPPRVSFPATVSGGESKKVPFTFKLSRFLDDGTKIDLVWLIGAYVNGVLTGTFMCEN